ncbi:MAG: NAD(P)/FAD-dependent oxidoreductase [Terriglobales bacterium]|jgi:2-polyprenyl-6-methoxyphenol hydroxylase-like FAD-dependent oxidoreductase
MASAAANSWDVFVVGGGPAGLATAIAARRHGLKVVVADGAVPPIDKPCGEGLMPDGVVALHNLGITIPEGIAYPFRGIRFLDNGASAEAVFPRGTAYGIRRTHLHRALWDHAAACGIRMLSQAAVTGLHPEGALLAGELVRARWVVGADGTGSRVRHWAALDQCEFDTPLDTGSHPNHEKSLRFAFRRHYRIAPWTRFMELHWGLHSQVYVTPVSHHEVCVALISSTPKSRLRIEDGLAEFPELWTRLEGAEHASSERGAITITRRLRRVYRGHTVLVGDASGGVDAITGEGLCLAFRQAALLGDCLASRDLARYQWGHRRLSRRPALMARMMLFMGRHSQLRARTMRVFQSSPRSFAGMLAMHVGEGSARDYISNGIALGWELLKA